MVPDRADALVENSMKNSELSANLSLNLNLLCFRFVTLLKLLPLFITLGCQCYFMVIIPQEVFLLTNGSELIQEYASIFRLFVMITAYKIHKWTKVVHFSLTNTRR